MQDHVSELLHAAELGDDMVRRVEELERDVRSLTEQVAQDFEELVLLQTLGSMLTLDADNTDPVDMLVKALSMLPNAAQSEGIAVILNQEVFVEFMPAAKPFQAIWSGEPLISSQACQELIQQYAPQAVDRPTLRNLLTEFSEGSSLQEFILIEIQHVGRVYGWLLGCNHIHARNIATTWTQRGFSTIEGGLLQTAASFLGSQLHNYRLLNLKERMFTDVVRAMVGALEARDPYTCGHSERVALFGSALARSLGKGPADCERIYLTGLLHDIGKIAVPDAVLQKPGALGSEERQLMETHTDAGWRILQPLQQLKEILPGVLYHHERFDGKGYPDGILGKSIPEDGRILAVCDAYDAMTSDRPYRKGMPQEKAEQILREGSGEYWDPDFIDAFLDNVSEMISIRETYRPRQQALRE